MSSLINNSPLNRNNRNRRISLSPIQENNPKNIKSDSQNNCPRNGSFSLSASTASKTYIKRTEKKNLMAEFKDFVQNFLDRILGNQTEKPFKVGSNVYSNEELKTLREIREKHPSEQSEEEKALITSFVDYVEESIQMQWALNESLKLEEDHQLETAMNKNLKEEFKPLKQKVFEELQLKVAIKESLKPLKQKVFEELLKQFPIEEARKHSILEGEGYYEVEEQKSENQNLNLVQNKQVKDEVKSNEFSSKPQETNQELQNQEPIEQKPEIQKKRPPLPLSLAPKAPISKKSKTQQPVPIPMGQDLFSDFKKALGWEN